MNTKKSKNLQEKSNHFNMLKWLAIMLAATAAMVGYGWLPESLEAFASLYMTLVCAGLLGLVTFTDQGQTATQAVFDAYNEIRFITWPKSHEVWQVTMVVVISLAVATVLLSVIDGVISFIFSYFIG